MLPIVVPSEDDSIQTALAALDEKLSAWVEAVSGVDADLRERLEFCEATEIALAEAKASLEAGSASIARRDGSIADIEEASANGEDTTLNETAEDDVEAAAEFDKASPSADLLNETTVEAVDPDEPLVAAPAPALKSAAPKRVSDAIAAKFATNKPVAPLSEPVPAPQVVEPPPQAAVVDEDEALLATLDEKTAKAIRVMRRLSPVKKSVKELLAEYQPDQPAKPESAAPARGSWWKRKSS